MWLQPESINDSALAINNYFMFRHDHQNRFRGGGSVSLCLISSPISCPDLTNPNIECIAIGINAALLQQDISVLLLLSTKLLTTALFFQVIRANGKKEQ